MNKSHLSIIRSLMLGGRWYTIPGLQVAIQKKTDQHVMETTISARIRGLRLSRYGGYEIQRERLPNSKLFRYRLVH